MNKTVLSLTFLALLLAGCQRPEPVEQVDDPMFLADVENFDSPTKTAMTSDRKVVWSKDDRIAIFHKSTQAREYVLVDDYAGESNGKFNVVSSGASIAGDALPCNVALYPYADGLALEVGVNDDVASYTISNVNLPAIQNYAPNSFGGGAFPMAAVTGSEDDRNLKFKNVLGVLKLSLKGTQTVMSIMVEGKNGELLSGAAEILLLSTNSNPQITMTSEDQESHYVTLDCGEGVQLSSSSATDFYITLPPATYTEGFKVTVTDSDSETHVFEATTSNTVIRSSILVMPEISLGGSDEEHPGGEDSSSENDYVDEYGINHGPGVEIDGVVWAPVNCGYHATDYKWGKLYQWGRKYGQGFSDDLYDFEMNIIGYATDATIPTIVEGPVSIEVGNSETSSNVFYKNNEYGYWLQPQEDNLMLWNSGSEESPVKTQYDPCPIGWRVPTYNELNNLSQNCSDWITNDSNITGLFFSGLTPYSVEAPKLFLPAAGLIRNSGNCGGRGYLGRYWSSLPKDERAWFLEFYPNMNLCDCVYGHSVRCVQDVQSVPVTSIVLNETNITLNINEFYQFVIVYPDNATDPEVTWKTSDSSIATIDQNGFMTALAAGTVVITATSGDVSATCSVVVRTPDIQVTFKRDYVDEYGINHGEGVEIDGVVWAPVNCGYHATDYKWGKLYQWGRKYGQGYEGNLYDVNGNYVQSISDATTPEFSEGGISLVAGNHKSNSNVFYYGSYVWVAPHDDDLWNSGSMLSPVKTQYDPCPEGWRVPTRDELSELNNNHSEWTTNEDDQSGYWFSGNSSYTETVPQVFLPAAGYRDYGDGDAGDRGYRGFYWSSKPDAYFSAYYFYINHGYASVGNYSFRADAFSVRCVQD